MAGMNGLDFIWKGRIFLRKVIIGMFAMLLAVLSGCGQTTQPDDEYQQKKIQMEPEISVYMHKTGETKTMKLEAYLEGVVAGEMRNDWDVEALAAQAIIARTYTLQALEKGELTSSGAQASTDIEEFQAYNAEAVNDRIKEAVKRTRGKIAAYQGRPIKGWFHASAGGRTALAKEGLDYKYEEPPYIQSVDSPDEPAPEDVSEWEAAFSKAEILAAVNKEGHELKSIQSVKIGRSGPSGRAVTLLINDAAEVSAPRLRLALGSTKMKSTLLSEIEIEGDQVVFEGKGYGHGVGMSQYGALNMARSGKKAEDIVRSYFKNIQIEKRW